MHEHYPTNVGEERRGEERRGEERIFTNVSTAPGLLTRMLLMVWKTSNTCSCLTRSRHEAIAQNVPLRPTPLLKENRCQKLNRQRMTAIILIAAIPYLHWTTTGRLPHFCCDFQIISNKFSRLWVLLGTYLLSQPVYWKCWTLCCA